MAPTFLILEIAASTKVTAAEVPTAVTKVPAAVTKITTSRIAAGIVAEIAAGAGVVGIGRLLIEAGACRRGVAAKG